MLLSLLCETNWKSLQLFPGSRVNQNAGFPSNEMTVTNRQLGRGWFPHRIEAGWAAGRKPRIFETYWLFGT